MALPLREDPSQNQALNRPNSDPIENRDALGEEDNSSSGDRDLSHLQREFDKLDAETDEEVDALRVNLLQDDDMPARDGSGRLVDDVAEEEISRFTEVGPLAEERGAESVVPGRDDPSRAFERNRLKPETISAEMTSDDSFDEPRDEEFERRRSA